MAIFAGSSLFKNLCPVWSKPLAEAIVKEAL